MTGIEAAMIDTGVSERAVPIHNLWGAPKNENVRVDLSKTETAISWSWSRENPIKRTGVNYIQPIYPSARITLKTPVTVGGIRSFNLYADYAYTQKPAGKYNLAFDIFLREKGTTKDNRVSEIMVWLDWTQGQLLSSYKGTLSDGNHTYKNYSWTKEGSFDYHSFLLEPMGSLSAQPVNLKVLIDLIKADKDWYISEVELGTEVWNGTGAVELRSFYLELNGEEL
jgi:hypothetical protein